MVISAKDRSSKRASLEWDLRVILCPPVVRTGCARYLVYRVQNGVAVEFNRGYSSAIFLHLSPKFQPSLCDGYWSPSDPTLCLCEAPMLEPGDSADVGVFISSTLMSPNEMKEVTCPMSDVIARARDGRQMTGNGVCTCVPVALHASLAGGPPKKIGDTAVLEYLV